MHDAALKDEARRLDDQLANLTSAIKLGGPLPALWLRCRRWSGGRTRSSAA
jgi:hypothetical protein